MVDPPGWIETFKNPDGESNWYAKAAQECRSWPARDLRPHPAPAAVCVMNRLAALLATMTLLGPGPAAAQTRTDPFQVGIQFGGALSSEFDRTDFGAGGRFAWHPTEVLGVESQVDFYPNDFAGSPPFSRSRL
jgi:hypothetical protein